MRVLNVGGCSKSIPIPEHFSGWDHSLLDIVAGPGVDYVFDARNMAGFGIDREFDAIYCSHNLEHYYRHDLPKVLAGFLAVTTDAGFVEIHVPDMGAVFAALAGGKDIQDLAYVSRAGPIKYADMIYGMSSMIEKNGNDFMCHKNGFTRKSLGMALTDAGFAKVFVGQNKEAMELVAYAFKQEPTADQYRQLKLKEKQ